MLNVFTLFLILMFGEGALHLVILIGIASLLYDFFATARQEEPAIVEKLEPAV